VFGGRQNIACMVGVVPSPCSGVLGKKLKWVSCAATEPLVSVPVLKSSVARLVGLQSFSILMRETCRPGFSNGPAFAFLFSGGTFHVASTRYKWIRRATS
jgi:hypothetical protein